MTRQLSRGATISCRGTQEFGSIVARRQKGPDRQILLFLPKPPGENFHEFRKLSSIQSG
jgi:hypothetical protein